MPIKKDLKGNIKVGNYIIKPKTNLNDLIIRLKTGNQTLQL